MLATCLLLGLAHGVSDAAVGFLIGQLAFSAEPIQAGMLALLYNGLAFGLQILIGIWADHLLYPQRLVAVGLLVSGLGCLLGGEPALATMLLGLGSAALHAAGGGLSIAVTPGKAFGPGLFAAPGVLGLALGSGLATQTTAPAWLFSPLLLALAIGVSFLHPPISIRPRRVFALFQGRNESIIVLLVTAFALRSAIWTSYQLIYQKAGNWLLWAGVAAFLGKACGGLLADRIGQQRWGTTSLILSAPLLALHDTPGAFLAGVFLLQASTPVILAALGQWMPGWPATAASLGLGVAVLLGMLSVLIGGGKLLGRPTGLVTVALLALLAAVLLWFAMKGAYSLPTQKDFSNKT